MTATSDKNKFNYKTNEVQSTKALREHLFKVLKDLFKQDYTNIETGLSTTFTDKDANKISHPTAIKKSRDNGFKKEEHFKVAENLVPLYENATLKETHPDYKGKPNIANVHRFHIDVNINDKEAEAKITVYEKIEGRNRIHTIELLKKLNPLPYSSRVQETEVAKSLNNGEVAHTTTPPIANSDSATIPNPTLNNTEIQSKNAVKETLELQKLDPLHNISRVSETEVVESLSSEVAPHNDPSIYCDSSSLVRRGIEPTHTEPHDSTLPSGTSLTNSNADNITNKQTSQAQETTNLKQITKDTAVLAPQSSALLIKTYEQLGEEKLAHTLISTIETDKVTMQEVSKEYMNLSENDEAMIQSSEWVDENKNSQESDKKDKATPKPKIKTMFGKKNNGENND